MKRVWFFWILIIILLSITFFLVYVFLNHKPSFKDQTPINQLNSLSQLYPKESIRIVTREHIATSSLPSDVRYLSNVSGPEVWAVKFEGDKAGFEIFYRTGGDVSEVFHDFVKSLDRKNWSIQSAVFSDKAGIINFYDKNYTVEVRLMEKDQGIDADVLIKKQ